PGDDITVPATNGIYVVDYNGGSSPKTTATPATATSVLQLATDGSQGFIEAVAVDTRGTAGITDDIVYFLTNDTVVTPIAGTASLWYHTGATTALVGNVPTLAGASPHTGLSFDPLGRVLYVSDQDAAGNTDSILKLALNLAGDTVVTSTPFALDTLNGQSPSSNETIPGQTAVDTLPVATVHNTAFTEGTPVLVDSALTIADPDVFLTSVTITISGGFAGDGDTLSFDTTGTAITGPASPVSADVNGNITLTLTGRDTLADYQVALANTLTFNSGNNPTNFGANPTRTVTWHFDDGAVGDPHSTGNTKVSTINITAVSNAPVVDLDLSNNHGTLLNYNAAYTVGGTPAAIADIDPSITDVDTATVSFATITLTNFVAGDLLSISGALPAHITASAYDSLTGVLTLTSDLGFDVTHAAYQQALQQVVFSTTSSDFATVRDISVVVDDGGAAPHASAPAHAFITVSGNAAPVANADSFTALEAGGLNNATAGNSPSGNLITGTGSATAVPDTDADGPVSALYVSAVDAVTPGNVVVTGVVGTAMTGKYGSLTVNSNGSYSYSLDNTNAAVQALVPAGATLADVFHYTIKDASGAASSSAAITITISGADDTALASADVGSMSEDAAVATTFNVRANDTLDPDAPATNAITLLGGATAVGNGSASGLGIDIGDVTRSVNGSNEIVVTLSGSDFQKLKVGDTATITLPYRLAGDTQNSDSSLTITVNGANDLPVAVDDTGSSMSEDAATTPFTVIGNDTLDVDRTAPTAATPGLVTTGTVTAVGNLTASGKVTGSDVTVGVNASNQITVSLGANFQKLSTGETATIDVTYLLHGDGADTSTAHLQVTVNGANDAPVVDLLNTAGLQTTGVTSTFTENGPVPPSVPVTVLPQVTLSDIDSTTLASATVTLTNAQTGVDVLTLSGQAGTSGTLNSGGSVDDDISWSIDTSTPGQISVNFTDAAGGNAPTLANYQSALQLIQFNNASDNPTQTDRTFTVTINDGVTTNAATTATLDFVAINDNPVNTVPGAQNAITTDTDYAFNGAKTISVSDADAGSGLIHTTLSAVHGDLTVTLGGATVFTGTNGTHTVGLQGTVTQINAALATLVYNSDAGYTDADTLQILTNDQGNSPAPAQSDTDTVSLNIIPKVWYIDDSVGAQSDATHFTSLAAFNTAHNAVSAANAPSFIYVRFGNDGVYSDTDGINLKPGEILLGQGADLTYSKTNGGTATLETGSSGLTPTITVTGGAGNAGVTLAQNNTLSGFNIAVSGADGIG
ncbi:MAG: hypothetical protein QOI72_1210, partial [Solirubrobacterales bacterium]|nr:hypothetical protein [Solirubrobacterales bacterium]